MWTHQRPSDDAAAIPSPVVPERRYGITAGFLITLMGVWALIQAIRVQSFGEFAIAVFLIGVPGWLLVNELLD